MIELDHLRTLLGWLLFVEAEVVQWDDKDQSVPSIVLVYEQIVMYSQEEREGEQDNLNIEESYSENFMVFVGSSATVSGVEHNNEKSVYLFRRVID